MPFHRWEKNHPPFFILMLIVPLAVNSIPFLALQASHSQTYVNSRLCFKIFMEFHTHQITRFVFRQNFTNYFGHMYISSAGSPTESPQWRLLLGYYWLYIPLIAGVSLCNSFPVQWEKKSLVPVFYGQFL
jgi:hypothetical protein